MYTYGNTLIILEETSLNNYGEFDAGNASTLVLQSGANTLEIGGNTNVTTHHLFLDADCSVNTGMLVNGDITMQSGITDITNYNISLGGNIVNEREESRITASGNGEIIKTVSFASGTTVNPGNLGFSFTPGEDYAELEIRRGHQPHTKGLEESINRYFSFGNSVLFNNITFSYFDTELNFLNEEILEIWGSTGTGEWEQIDVSVKDYVDNKFIVDVNEYYNLWALFPGELISEGKEMIAYRGFSPNGDGMNDYFFIDNLPAQNELIILNRWGNEVFKSSSYNNDWDGTGINGELLVGTYFYFLKSNGKIIDKGYIYINRENY